VPDLAEKARLYVSKIGDPSATEAFVDWLNFRKHSMTRMLVRILLVTGWFDFGHCYQYDLPLLSKLTQEIGFKLLPQNLSPSASWRLNDPAQVNILLQKPGINTGHPLP
jgi:hypothetical protein